MQTNLLSEHITSEDVIKALVPIEQISEEAFRETSQEVVVALAANLAKILRQSDLSIEAKQKAILILDKLPRLKIIPLLKELVISKTVPGAERHLVAKMSFLTYLRLFFSATLFRRSWLHLILRI